METKEAEKPRSYNILVYGIEKVGITPPANDIKGKNFSLVFEPFKTNCRFNDFDGVILFQGIFEKFEKLIVHHGRQINHDYDCDELDKRKKELSLLLKKEGFVCFILCKPFIDRAEGISYKSTDLAKVCLIPSSSFFREDYSTRNTNIESKQSEFCRFFSIYGAASSYFSCYDSSFNMRVIAEAGSKIVGMIIYNQQFFVPSLIPENIPERVEEYFKLLADALTSTYNKLLYSIPAWVNEFQFSEEEQLFDRKKKILVDVKDINTQLEQFQRYKRILLFDGDTLVEAVVEVLRQGFGLKVDESDEYREDIKILNDKGTPIIFGEIKGANGGVKREHINQVDGHRERAELDPKFPAILIINTHIKNSRTVAEKDKEPQKEQVTHAINMNVLVLRTLDLLGLLRLSMKDKVTMKEILTILKGNCGWLKVTDHNYEVVS